MLQRVSVDDESHPMPAAASVEAETAGPAPSLSLDAFLAGVEVRAFRFAEIGLRQRDDALDAVQDAMMKMLAYADRPAAEWTPLFWSILRSRIVDIQRRRSMRLRWFAPPPDDDRGGTMDWANDPAPGPGRTHEGKEAYRQLADALDLLPRRQREAFSLRILEELDVATTARVMGCSEGAVKTHLSRARDALQRHLEPWQ